MAKTTQSLAQQTANRLSQMIIEEQKFSIGDRLPSEHELSSQFGISRATLRESIGILTNQGILESHRGRGTFVSNNSPLVKNEALEMMGITRSNLRELYEARLILEPQAAALACKRASDEEIEEICRQGELVAQQIKNKKDRTEEDQRFHQLICEAAHNSVLEAIIPTINRAIRETPVMKESSDLLSEYALNAHALIMDFLRARDSFGAQNAMETHLRHAIFVLGLANDI